MKGKSRKPLAVQQRIITRASLGESKSQIARELHVHRNTVSRLLSAADIMQTVQEVRSDMVLAGDLQKSAKVLRAKLNRGSESAATTILRGFHVLQSGSNTTVNLQNNGAMAWLAILQQKEMDSRSEATSENESKDSEVEKS